LDKENINDNQAVKLNKTPISLVDILDLDSIALDDSTNGNNFQNY